VQLITIYTSSAIAKDVAVGILADNETLKADSITFFEKMKHVLFIEYRYMIPSIILQAVLTAISTALAVTLAIFIF